MARNSRRSKYAPRRKATPKGRYPSGRSSRYAPTRGRTAYTSSSSRRPPRSGFTRWAKGLLKNLKRARRAAASRREPVRATRQPLYDRRPSQAEQRAPLSRQRSSPAVQYPPRPGLSLDRKLDLLGVFLVIVVGLPTLLVLLSARNSASTGNWAWLLKTLFGWGAYLFPITSIIIGMWLIMRNFERIPRVSVERVVGLILLYFNALAILHYFSHLASDKVGSGQGGGSVGGAIFGAFHSNLGWGGAAIALLAWLIIALALALDVTVLDLFRWVQPLKVRFEDAWDDFRSRRKAMSQGAPATDRQSPAVVPPVPPPATQGALPASSFSPPSTSKGVAAPPVWVLPPVDQILETGGEVSEDDDADQQRARVIEQTLASFGAPVKVIEVNRGPTITQFGVEPDFIETRNGKMRVRVGKISSLVDDLALALSARTIRVQAPVPGKGYVGIEVPNEKIALVALRDVIESEAFLRLKSPLRFAIGQDVAGNAVAADLVAMPHLLIAGATGSGKSVCVNALICCLLMHNTPDDLRLIMVDPKRVELTGYNGIPHLLAPVVVEMERVVGALQWVLREMDNRYHKLAQAGARNITEYNGKLGTPGPLAGQKKLPRLVVIIDELADLMILAPDETERTITRLAQLARATGIHLVISTQRPSVDVVTGLIKANIPARIAFAVAANVDSRVVLDQPGADRLLGRGDMLFQAPDAPAPIRLQGAFVSDAEIQRLVQYWRNLAGTAEPAAPSAGGVVDALPSGVPLKQMPLWEEMQQQQEEGDPLLAEAIDLVRRQGRASITMLQRRMRIGYTRAARLVESMQEKRIIGDETGPQGFEVLDYGPAAPPVDEAPEN